MLASLVIVWVVIRLCKGLIESLSPVLLRQLDLVDKSTALAASHDLMVFQGVQAMDQRVVGYPDDAYDPSDAAEAEREAARQGISVEQMKELRDADEEQLRALF